MKENNLKYKKIDEILEKTFSILNNRQIKIINYRYGFQDGKEKTLQEIGDKFNITRERVRQILKRVNEKIKKDLLIFAEELINFSKNYLEKVGGVREEEIFLKDILAYFQDISKNNLKKLKFIYLVLGYPFYYEEDDNFKSFWYLKETDLKKIKKFHEDLMKFFESKNKEDILEKKIHLKYFKDFNILNMLNISKKVGVNLFGDFGLIDWIEIKPKNIRDKIYLVLKKSKKPLHFREIVKEINRLKFDHKKAYPQTVHNELIKDERFVLVGRGIYSLKEFGYLPGTAKELITYFLKKHGPLTKNEVIDLINQQRILKRQTIILNLQNNKNFKRLKDGRYYVKEI
ncbi:MAG: sigma factor-like helix-turn-helix DNA-binding protein [Candidatus Pacearchaeota archaeon]